MSVALTRENFFWHKVHSLTGIVPVGFYMLQHLVLNSFSWAGADYFNGVVHFFASLPVHFLLALEILLIWLPLLFHAVYGLFIIGRGTTFNYFASKYKWSQNRMYMLQRVTGIIAFLFLVYHVLSTTVAAKMRGEEVIQFNSWQSHLTSTGYLFLAVYLIGVAACSYHLAYGVWNFCIRWGITVGEAAQIRVQKFAAWMFIVVTLLGWMALGGFLKNPPTPATTPVSSQAVNV